MNKRLMNLWCCLTPDVEKKIKDGCYKAYFLEAFIGDTVRRMNKILDDQEVYIKKLEKRITTLEERVNKNINIG